MYEPVGPFAQAIGEGVLAYANVERSQAVVLSALLHVQHDKANAIFYTIKNVRARCETMQTLLRQEYKGDYEKYWKSCCEFLQKLSKFRNAVAHWHPAMRVSFPKPGKIKLPGTSVLINPSPGWGLKSLTVEDIPPFVKDCRAIQQELEDFAHHLGQRHKTREMPLPDRFQQPIAHQNLAVLQRHPKPKAQKPQPRPSRA